MMVSGQGTKQREYMSLFVQGFFFFLSAVSVTRLSRKKMTMAVHNLPNVAATTQPSKYPGLSRRWQPTFTAMKLATDPTLLNSDKIKKNDDTRKKTGD
eukprot:SAG11_NODE_160_length_14023_cov_23.003017_5_plen_98_part_00